MSTLVLDASAALRLPLDDQGEAEVRAQVRDRISAGEPILVPPIFWLEVVNVLAHRYRYPPDAIVEALYELEQIGVAAADIGRPTVLAVIDAVGRSGLSAYDAAYLVLAESANATLLTADVRLAAAGGDRATLVGSPGQIAESPAVFAADGPSWADWNGAAAYLRELRAALSEGAAARLRLTGADEEEDRRRHSSIQSG